MCDNKKQYVEALEEFILEYFKEWKSDRIPSFPITGDTNFAKDLRMVDFQIRPIINQFEERFSVKPLTCSWLYKHAFHCDVTINDLLDQYGLGGKTDLIPESLKGHEHIEEMYKELANNPERSEVLERTQWYRTGLVLENGIVSLWDDSDTLEVDIYNINALELMVVLDVRTVDELFKAVKERSIGSWTGLSKFLDERGIKYSAYSSVPDRD
jgi:hypothetical protein